MLALLQDSAVRITVAVLCAYLAGSVPFGLLVAKWFRGIDLREHGSRNIGASNVGRTLGWRFGAGVLLLDALKGAFSVSVLPWLLLSDVSDSTLTHARVACGVAAVLGHTFPCWLRFRGGKGVATALGVVLVLAPLSSALALTTFIVVLLVGKMVSLASITASLVYLVSEFVHGWPAPFDGEHMSRTLFAVAVPVLILARHSQNIGRIVRGEENRVRWLSRRR